jgi:hypothetical protein
MKSARTGITAAILSLAGGSAAAPSLPNDIALDAAPAARPVTFSTWFNSDATWPVDGGVSHAMPVCLGAGVPSSCPTTGPVVHYNFPASGWAANLAFIPNMQWIWDGAQIAENNAPENDELHTAKFFDLPDCANRGAQSLRPSGNKPARNLSAGVRRHSLPGQAEALSRELRDERQRRFTL